MKQINFSQKGTPQGDINGIMRISGKLLYLKLNNNQYAQQFLAQMQQKGAIITLGRGWARINIFGVHDWVKLGDIEFNPQEKKDEEMEEILLRFYLQKYKEAKFELTWKEVEN
jgi:hypothetical protein